MPHDGMPRAYLRIDPNLDLTQADPGSFVRLLCAAARQPDRGRFKDRALLERAVGRVKARTFIDRGDVTLQPDGRCYVQGWDEWQEGDYSVADRMRRMRHRRAEAKAARVTVPPSPKRNAPVSPDTLAPTLSVTTDAVSTHSLGVVPLGVGVGDEIPPPPTNGGRRADRTNPRAVGASPRQNGTSPRETGDSPRKVREAQKRGPSKLSDILARAATAGHES